MTSDHFIQYDTATSRLTCQGDWILTVIPQLKIALSEIPLPQSGQLFVDGGGITTMDSAGAWLLKEWSEQLQKKGIQVQFENFSKQFQQLLTLVNNKEIESRPEIPVPSRLESIGKLTMGLIDGFNRYLIFIGQLTFEAFRLLRSPKHLRWRALGGVVYKSGFQALPIIAILSFMIGIVITYQMGLQLRNYGANIYIVDLLGLSILREFAPLLTAIMVAGRTGSSFTAQLGMMKINQEIDALDTIGVTPAELLLLPRIAGLFISLPLITMWANIFGVMGGMVMANNMLNITWYDFLHRFPAVIPLRALLIGIGKAPVFALIIASIGCFQGIRVTGSATSVGQNTTRSVVLSIFYIILADAIFSIIFSKLKL